MSRIEIKGLRKTYGDVVAIEEFDLRIKAGQVVALVGPDGAGKTTIMRTVCNLIAPDAGVVLIDGAPVKANREVLKTAIGYMPQTFSLYTDLSVQENLIFYAGIYGVVGDRYVKRRDELYEFSRLAPFAGRRAGALSGGMKQKLALSCALIHDPKILILDEPTTGVDPLSRRQLWEILLQFQSRGMTILVSTPYMDEVAKADQACLVFCGKKLAEGTPHELSSQFEGGTYFLEITPDRDKLARLNAVDGLSARRFGSGMHLQSSPRLTPEDVTAALTRSGLDRTQCRAVAPSLEDTFVQLMHKQERSQGHERR
ncbi:MAG: ABC transporter ATP-binding protein [bacterium]